MTTATEVAPGTLPRLRFGRTYAFRARAVDLAGNSHPFDPGLQVDDDVRTMDRMYRRFEPVQTPLLVRREEYTEGESLTHLVIRSNGVPGSAEEVNAGAYADGLNESTGKTIYRAHSDRHVLPPKTSQDIAEAHGGFDALLDAVAPAATATLYNDIVARDAALVPDVDGNSVIDLLHLADPYAVGVHFTAFDGKGALLGKELDHRFDVSSPPAGTFRLEVVEGTMFSMVTVDPRLVRITVPRGERIRIELSSLFTRDESPAESAKL
jgi:hypothetical protein